MEHDDYSYKLWRLVIIGVILILLSVSGCCVHQNIKIAQTIENGTSPELARLAFSVNTRETEVITALFINKEN